MQLDINSKFYTDKRTLPPPLLSFGSTPRALKKGRSGSLFSHLARGNCLTLCSIKVIGDLLNIKQKNEQFRSGNGEHDFLCPVAWPLFLTVHKSYLLYSILP